MCLKAGCLYPNAAKLAKISTEAVGRSSAKETPLFAWNRQSGPRHVIATRAVWLKLPQHPGPQPNGGLRCDLYVSHTNLIDTNDHFKSNETLHRECRKIKPLMSQAAWPLTTHHNHECAWWPIHFLINTISDFSGWQYENFPGDMKKGHPKIMATNLT